MATRRKPAAPATEDETGVPQGRLTPLAQQEQEPTAADPPRTRDEQRTNQLLELWAVMTRARVWRSLAVVPVSDASALATAQAIAGAANLLSSRPIQLMNAERLEPAQVEGRIRELQDQVKRDERVMVVLSPVVTHPAGLPLVHAADAALLCVPLYTTGFAAAHKTVELVGREHFIGTVTLKAGKKN